MIGIHAVDGRGVAFKGGGRVVKNVAGYDFCKLLTGSLGTLAVVTQLALKVKPRPECAATITCECADSAIAADALARLSILESPPAAIDWLAGSGWDLGSNRNQIVVRVAGTEPELAWLAGHVQTTLSAAGATAAHVLSQTDANSLFSRQIEFSDRGPGESDDGSPMVVKIAVPPSTVAAMIGNLLAVDANCTIQAHAGNGIIVARFSEFRHSDVTKWLVGKLRPAAVRLDGSLVVVRSNLEGLTPHVVWGGRTDATILLERIKRQFDPRNILNPGRFAYD